MLPFIGYCGALPGPNPWRAGAAGMALCLLLGSCVSAPPAAENSDWQAHRAQLQQLQTWALRGRVDIRYDNDSHTPRIQWQQHNDEYHIRLWGTFNAGNTLITGRPGYVTMETGDDVITATSPEQLILQQLGYELPVSYLEYWIKGIPAPAEQANLVFNELNQVTRIEQADWTVNYSDPRQYGEITLPARMEVTRPANDIRLRFIGLNWTLDNTTN